VIAIVDDDQAMLDAIAELLTARGFAVQVFTVGACDLAGQASVIRDGL